MEITIMESLFRLSTFIIRVGVPVIEKVFLRSDFPISRFHIFYEYNTRGP